ncbi:homoserine kinase [Brachybacterium hainanense]|uniref:Homoserine kinase n=1 Tax=Brachybacterium hainanense TaxID=1541174 RepID=A0ABV6R8Y2_9MICO
MRIGRRRAAVRVPATSANLGPGFDAMGLALMLHDDLEIEAMAGGLEIEVTGEGAEDVPRTEEHLVLRALRIGLDHAGAPQIGVRLRARNRIPHGRGLGSSAAAAVAGLLLARGLLADPDALDDQQVLELATEIEGHPDNAAPALLGGVTLSWMQRGLPRSVRLSVAEGALSPTVLLPSMTLSTATARSLLPAEVPHADAAFAAGRAGLLVHALAADPSLLLPATEDRLHQEQRAPGMPQSVELMRVLRAEGFPAVISGAGPTVLVLAGDAERLGEIVRRAVDRPQQWRLARIDLDVAGAGAVVR